MSSISYRHHRRLDGAQIAAGLAATGFAALGVFQSALALDAPLGHAAWGGDSADLTTAQQVASGVSVVIFATAGAVVLARAGLIRRPQNQRLLSWSPWIFAALLAMSALANFASRSHWENYVLGPVAVVLAVLCVIVARSPMTPR